MEASTLRRKAPSQERSRRMVEWILDATARVLSERNSAEMTTNLIATVAGVSVGSIYQYFPDKKALIAALHARHSRQMHDVVIAVLSEHRSSSLRESIGAVTRALLAAHFVDLKLHRMLERQFAFFHGAEDGSHDDSGIRQQVYELLQRHQEQIAHQDLQFATWFTMCTIHALVHEAVIESPQYCSLSQLEPAITDAVMGFLTSRRCEMCGR
jgi:AcrR family transcriptional regulator